MLDEEHEKDIQVVQKTEESPRDDDVESEPRVLDIEINDLENANQQDRVVMISDCDENSE